MFTLDDNFVNFYRNIKPDWGFPSGPNSIGELTYARTYSRIKPDGNNETWVDTVRRVVEGTYEIQRRHAVKHDRAWDPAMATESAQEMFDRIFNFKFLPPGRGLWMMGTDYVMERDNGAPLNNCFAGETEIITREYGPVRLDSLVGETVTTYSSSGWSKGEVRSFGVQPTQRITFAPAHADGRRLRSNIVVDVVATPDHRWILSDGTETTSLSTGDIVPTNAVEPYDPDGYDEGMRHGLIFGDGTRDHFVGKDGLGRFHIRLCGEKAQAYRHLFGSVTLPPSANGDPVAHVKSFDDLKSFPVGKSPGYLRGFVEGWMVADASTNPSGSYILASQRTDALDWLKVNGAEAGYIVVGHSTDNRETNFGERKNPLNKITLVSSSQFKVVSIAELDEQEVFCATVPGDENFTLGNGLLTGNCAFISTEEVHDGSAYPFTFLMDMSMLGVGVGFDTNGAGAKVRGPIRRKEADVVVVPDSREGWVWSIEVLIESYLQQKSEVVFDYSEVRKAGEPIKGFGGTASGPAPLKKLHDRLRNVLDGATDRGSMNSRDIVDMQNMIGACVVAGNVRRSAELALGEWSDEEFINLKNYEQNPERAEWGWASNNTVVVRDGDKPDYSAIAERIADNGEPGLFYIDVARAYGRMGDEPDYADYRVAGTNPCAEQMLESGELCTLVEVFPTRTTDIVDFLRTLKFAYLYAKTVTLIDTHDERTNEIMRRNRRIGTSASGMVQFVHREGKDSLKQYLRAGYGYIDNLDKKYSKWLGIPTSIRKTTVKPSGTVSLLAGATPGVHYPTADYYIRRIRLQEGHALVDKLIEAGYTVEQDVYSDNTLVVEMPVKGEGLPTEYDVSVFDKAEMATFMAEHWSDNGVSCTITFQPHETECLETVLTNNEGKWKTVSFLPISRSATAAYAQMPYEEITPARYDDMVRDLKPVDLTPAGSDGEMEEFCTTDICEIKYIGGKMEVITEEDLAIA